VEAHKPNTSINKSVKHDPWVSFDVQLLNRSLVTSCLVAYCVNISMTKGTAIWATNCLLKTWQSFLVHGADFEIFTLLQVLSFQWSTNDIYYIFKLGNSKVDSIVHHFTQSFKCFRWNVKQQNLRTRNICRPIKLICLITAYNQDIAFVNYNNFTFTDFLIKNFETGPLQSFKVIKCMLVQLSEIEKLLRNTLSIIWSCATTSLWFIHCFQVFIFLFTKIKFIG